jgi:hypothetical protein
MVEAPGAGVGAPAGEARLFGREVLRLRGDGRRKTLTVQRHDGLMRLLCLF